MRSGLHSFLVTEVILKRRSNKPQGTGEKRAIVSEKTDRLGSRIDPWSDKDNIRRGGTA